MQGGTYSKGITVFYDGKEVASSTMEDARFGIPPAGDGRIVVGRYYTDTDERYSSVQVDELLFFNQALSPADVIALNNSVSILWKRMIEGSHQPVHYWDSREDLWDFAFSRGVKHLTQQRLLIKFDYFGYFYISKEIRNFSSAVMNCSFAQSTLFIFEAAEGKGFFSICSVNR